MIEAIKKYKNIIDDNLNNAMCNADKATIWL